MVWIPPIQNSRGCEWVKFFPGRRQGEGLRGTGSLRNPGPWSARLGLPGMGQSPGSRFRCLGPRTHTVRTKGASFCLKAPAARLPHRNISATRTLYHLLAFLLTDRTTGQTPWAPARSTPQLPSHALYAGSSFQLREGIGQLNWPARARGRGSAAGGLVRRRNTQRRIAIGSYGERFAPAPGCQLGCKDRGGRC